MLTSAILKFDVVCDVAITSTPNVLTTELRDLLYNQCIDSTCCYSFFIYPMGRIRICKIRFVRTGENRENPCPVCKKKQFSHVFRRHPENPPLYQITFGYSFIGLLHCYRWILSLVVISKDASVRASADIPTRDSIHRYQCDNPFIYIIAINISCDFR